MQGHEIRDQYFARLFGLVSVIQSGLLFRNSTLPTSGSSKTHASTLSDFQTVGSELLTLGEKKSWLRETCWWALDLALHALSSSSVDWKDKAVEWMAETIYTEKVAWTPEKLALTVVLQRVTQSLSWKKLLAPTFKDSDVLSSRNVPIVAKILRVR
jgi:DNA polymerase phi